eukprot:TRINITY_DN16752_c1_g1_i1.p1 TRINITY_DN16752_c1_g1~~TRINITY_DN16752_c1_g1_i1.p1  ORF type:complete len:854 (+),score=160.01 TRINITY_DN16752_c1_g1_i1:264-2564(+)
MASMRTHATPVKSAGHAGDGMASMRTHATPVKSAGHAGDGMASMRTHATPVKSAGATTDVQSSVVRASMTSSQTQPQARTLVTMSQSQESSSAMPPPMAVAEPEQKLEDFGDYWLPWHIDSNFVTILHNEMYAKESDASLVPEPEGAGLMVMNKLGDVRRFTCTDPDALLLQVGGFGQIYTGGHLTAGRHAVASPRPPGIARFNYCNFWYVPWDTVCDTPEGLEEKAVSKGWNAMMDESYLNITMRQSFSAFRQFMVSPEARVQFANTELFKNLSELIPLSAPKVDATTQSWKHKPESKVSVDILTDVRCPFSFISQTNLESAIREMGMEDRIHIEYHPVFLNPNVPEEGECLDDYLMREFGYTKEFAHSEDYPLRKLGLEAGVELNPNRRVVNTFNAFCLMEVAREAGVQHQLVKVLSQRYFVQAQDISKENVLREIASECGLEGDASLARMQSPEIRQRVQERYQQLSEMVQEVPHFLLRDQINGLGMDVGGNRTVEGWKAVIDSVLEKSSLTGLAVPGLGGQDTWLAYANPHSQVTLAFKAQHDWVPASWPYKEEDFKRMDESDDAAMYAEPRFVNHLDESSLQRLREVYRAFFSAASEGFSVLDMCSSWISHFPDDLLKKASRVAVHGLNELELKANTQATETLVQNLNLNSTLPYESGSFDFVTNALSVHYLTDPRAVFSEMHRVLKPGGLAVVAFSHRCFIEKTVNVWAKETDDGEGHAHLICRYFQHGPVGGWEKLSTVDVSPQHGDPMWLVTAVKAKN